MTAAGQWESGGRVAHEPRPKNAVYNFRIVNRAGGRARRAARATGGTAQRPAKSGEQGGGRSPQAGGSTHPGAPIGGGGAGGRRGEPHGRLSSPREVQQRVFLGRRSRGNKSPARRLGAARRPQDTPARQPGRPRSQRPGAGAEKAGRQPGRAPGREQPGPEARRDGQGGTRRPARWQQANRSKGRATEQGARTGADGRPKPDDGSAKGPGSRRREAPREGAGGNGRGPARASEAREKTTDPSREAGAGAQAAAGPAEGQGPRRKGGTATGRKKGPTAPARTHFVATKQSEGAERDGWDPCGPGTRPAAPRGTARARAAERSGGGPQPPSERKRAGARSAGREPRERSIRRSLST